MKPFAVVLGLLASTVCLIVLITLATQTTCEVYTISKFQNLLQIAIILEAGVISAEASADSTAREVGIDSVIVIIVSVATNIFYFNQGIALFSGEWLIFDLMKKLFIPTLVVTGFAGFNGADGVTKLMVRHKLRNAG